jgi:hypothetical protein
MATIWPLIYIPMFAWLMIRAIRSEGADDAVFSPITITAHLLAFATILILLVIYIRDVLRRDLSDESQAVWGVLMTVFGPVVMLVYWWRYFRRSSPQGVSS